MGPLPMDTTCKHEMHSPHLQCSLFWEENEQSGTHFTASIKALLTSLSELLFLALTHFP